MNNGPESDDDIKAISREQIGFVNLHPSSSSHLDDEKREILKAANARLAKSKRSKEATNRTYSEGQRR